MRLGFLGLPADERRLYIEQAATRRNLSPVLLEKDFWVCWILGLLFGSEFAGSLVFKGGTSLSKVFGVIERFSEDIDLSLSPEFLNLPEAGTSRNQANKWMTRAETACASGEDADRARSGSGRGGSAWEAGWRMVRVPDGRPHELAGAPVPLPVVAGGGIRVPQTLGKTGVRFSYRPTAGRPPPNTAVGCRCPACRIFRLAVRSRSPGSRAQFLGEGYDPSYGIPPAGRETNARPVLPPLCGYGGSGKAPHRERGHRPTRPPRSGRGMEEPVLWQFVGELRPGETGDVPPSPTARAAAGAARRLPGDAGHVSRRSHPV